VSIRPEQPEPFLRGCVFPAVTEAPYPRADPAGADYLPADVWDAAQLPVGVRLELAGNARTIRVWYKTTRASLGYRGESAGCTFVAYRGGQKVATAEAVMGEGMAELVISGRTDLPVTVYLPEGMQPLITGVAGVEETMVPAPLQPRWLAYGDAVTQGWLASAPAMAWPAVAGRKLGLDVCNLGYAGTARGETTSALMLAETPAEVVTIAFGLNNWSRVPHTVGLMAEEVRCFLSVVRQGHPEIPVVVVSPTARPDAEDVPNRVGATLAELRQAMEETVLDTIAQGDDMLFLVQGLAVVDPEDLEDGMYPGDEGHRRLAAAVAKILVPHLPDLQSAAEKRWANTGVPISPRPASSVRPSSVPGSSVPVPSVVGPSVVGPSVVGPSVDEAVSVGDETVEAVSVEDRSFEVGPDPDASGVAESVADPVAGDPVADDPVPEGGSVEVHSVDGASGPDVDEVAAFPRLDFEAWNGALFDTDAPDFGLATDDRTGATSRNFDLTDMDSLDRQSLNDALLDALAPTVSPVNGSPVNGSPVNGSPVNGSPVNGAPVKGAPVKGAENPIPALSGDLVSGAFVTGALDAALGDPAFIDPAFVDPDFVDPDYVDPPFVDPAFVDPAFVDPNYVELDYVDSDYVDSDYVDSDYVDSDYVDPVFLDPNYVAPAFVDPNYVDSNYVDSNYADPTYVDSANYADPTYVDPATYVDPSYVDPSYVDPTYVDPTYVDSTYVDSGYGDSTYGDPAFTQEVSVGTVLVAEYPPEQNVAEVPVDAIGPVVGTTTVFDGENGPATETTVAPGAVGSGQTATEGEPHRRPTAPVDIAVADMVVAALTLATNGADDIVYGEDPGSVDTIRWAEAADPTPS
jgi:lysophospholipase L1-like esterase